MEPPFGWRRALGDRAAALLAGGFTRAGIAVGSGIDRSWFSA